MHLNIYHLTIMQGSAGLAVMIFGPVWALLVDRKILGTKTLLVIGSAGWGLTSLLIASCANDFARLLSLRFICTAFLASGAPIAQSIIGSMVAPEMRGRCFSYVAVSGSVAVIMTSNLSTAISEQHVMGLAGWRFGLICVGLLSLAFSAVTSVKMQEPSGKGAIEEHLPGSVNVFIALRNLRDHWQLRSFRLLCMLGSFCSFSWQVMIFSTLYFQYRGLPDWQAGLVTSCWHAGDLLANMAGGAISDALHSKYSTRGRLYLAQASFSLTLPVLVGIFVILPRCGVVAATPYAILMFLFGLSVGSCVAAVNKPLLSQIAPAGHIASIMAWEQTLENAIGGMWGPAAILILQSLAGYRPSNVPASQMLAAHREHNANALAFVIFSFTFVSYVCVLAGYTALHWTIPQDLGEKCTGPGGERSLGRKLAASEYSSLLTA